jgi:hypothetical protein
MAEIDRRTAIGVAGATMALAACKPADGGGGAAPEHDDRSQANQWGEDPHATGPKVPPPGGFNPRYLCVVYIKFTDSNMIVRHGYTETTAPSGPADEKDVDARQRADAEALLNEAVKGDWKTSRAGHPRKEVNFERFDFGQQMRLFFYIDNDGINFDGRMKGGKYANLLRFSKYSSVGDMVNYDPKKVDPNHAFFGATLTPLTVGGKQRQALRLDNWYCGPNGKPVDPKDPKTHQFFYMYLNLLWTAAEAGTKVRTIPIVIDPGGGNMGSQP